MLSAAAANGAVLDAGRRTVVPHLLLVRVLLGVIVCVYLVLRTMASFNLSTQEHRYEELPALLLRNLLRHSIARVVWVPNDLPTVTARLACAMAKPLRQKGLGARAA